MALSLTELKRQDQRWLCSLSSCRRRQRWDLTARWVSRSGDGPLYAVIVLLGGYWYEGELAQQWWLISILAFAIEIPCFVALKHLLKRQRPYHLLPADIPPFTALDSFSLPSGHAAAAANFSVLSGAFFIEWGWLTACWALAVGVSRVMLGVHYPSDIIAGYALGTSAATTALVIMQGV